MEKNSLIIVSGASGGLGEVIIKELAKKSKILAIFNKNKPKVFHKNIKFLKLDLSKNLN